MRSPKHFSDIDIIVTPTAPGLPEKIRDAQNPSEASGAEPSVRNTFPFNIFGIPTISVPCGFSRSGLPIGLQISGPPLGELSVLAWHMRTSSRPNGTKDRRRLLESRALKT